MNTLTNAATTEPVRLAAAVRVLLVAVAAFGVGITAEQIAALVLVVEVWSAILVRDRVSPVA
jgi:hypothetical protein